MPGPEPFDRAVRVLAASPAILTALVRLCQANRVVDSRLAADAWSPRDILAHLLVVERDINLPRLHRLADQDAFVIQPVDPTPTPTGEVDELLAEWQRERTRTLAWLRTLPPEVRSRTSIHPRHGRITFEQHVVAWAYHDLDHLRQLLGIIGGDLYPHMGSWQALYSPSG